ncbi:hypothetical protein RHMOL_Rhmol11G0214700 [Rhododendron molle]|uniref:Uncharacterized protein n=1 Tax=Rhododendron molle TaxID=49168 RepID=A0ACC0LVN7_RHOML|nr:hypothetical protein RHMOL_Rhmol11G0214700 [Rhododendron molle]
MGYLAPECLVTNKASKESDVYSFGIVALEIACGRKPLDSKVPESQMRLVEWVWDLYGMGRLLKAVDAKLGSDFDVQETERLMIVGLWCAHPDHNFRPKIRDVIHVLINFEAPLPILPPKLPALSFSSLPLHTTTTISDTNQNQFSSNVDSSKFISSSTASSSSIKVFNKDYLNAKNSFKTQLQYSTAMAILNFKILLYSLSMFFFCILFPQTTSLTFDLTDLSLPDQNVNITTSPRAYRSTRGLEVTPNTLDANLQLEAGKVS